VDVCAGEIERKGKKVKRQQEGDGGEWVRAEEVNKSKSKIKLYDKQHNCHATINNGISKTNCHCSHVTLFTSIFILFYFDEKQRMDCGVATAFKFSPSGGDVIHTLQNKEKSLTAQSSRRNSHRLLLPRFNFYLTGSRTHISEYPSHYYIKAFPQTIEHNYDMTTIREQHYGASQQNVRTA